MLRWLGPDKRLAYRIQLRDGVLQGHRIEVGEGTALTCRSFSVVVDAVASKVLTLMQHVD